MKNLTWQNPEQLFVAQELINKVKSKCCGIKEITEFVRSYIPSKTDWTGIKNRIVMEGERVKVLTRISVDINIQNQEVTFALPDFGLTNKETVIESHIWEDCKEELVKAKETWGVVELGYKYPEGKIKGKIKLVSFKNFCPYTIDLDFYKDVRQEFDIHEWIDTRVRDKKVV